MKKQQKIKNFATAALLTIATPTIASAASSTGFESGNDGFSALTNFSDAELASIGSLSNDEMSEIQGEFFNFAINIAVLPQINVCLFCFDTTQINSGSIIGINMLQ